MTTLVHKAPFALLVLACFFSPFFCLWGEPLFFKNILGAVFFFGVISVLLVCYYWASLRKGVFEIKTHFILFAFSLVISSEILTLVFSENHLLSFRGNYYEPESFSVLLGGLALLFLSIQIMGTKKRATVLLVSFFVAMGITFFVHAPSKQELISQIVPLNKVSFIADTRIMQAVFSEGLQRTLTGSGQNTFFSKRTLYGDNTTGVFAEETFESNIPQSGFLQVLGTTRGLLGGFVWLVFLGGIVYFFFREISYSFVFRRSSLPCFLSGVSLVFWFVFVFIFQSTFLLFSAILFTGAGVSLLNKDNELKKIHCPSKTLFQVYGYLGLVVLLVVVAAALLFLSRDMLATIYLERAKYPVQNQEDNRLAYALRATDLFPKDIYYAKAANLFLEQAKKSEKGRQENISTASGLIQNAIQQNRHDYRYSILLGRILAFQFQTDGRLEEKRFTLVEAYDRGLFLRPGDPYLTLEAAYAHVLIGNLPVATKLAKEAMFFKSDFQEAEALLIELESFF
ncbi:MAG TPA: hypothetical protein VJB70_01455 [Candidatus Paceibacterota bacterium]